MENQILKAEKIIFGGNCISKIEEGINKGKTVLISGALPNEVVEVEFLSSTKDYEIGKVVKILEKSPHRIEPKCKYFGICGGCNLQFATDEYQVQLRKEILFDNLSVIENNNVKLPELKVISDNSWSYRNRFQFHNGGLMELKSNKSIKIDKCLVACDEINTLLSDKEFTNNSCFLNASRYHVFGYNQCLKGAILQEKNTNRIVGKSKKKVKSGGKRKIYEGTLLNPESLMSIQVLDREITFDVKGFFQSNVKMLEKTIEILKKDFGGENILDMYAGVGTFSTFLLDNFNNSVLVEHNRDAISLAEINLQGKKHESYGISGDKWAKEYASKIKTKFDGVVIDPPRSGIEKSVLDWLCNSNIPSIRSLSCDPITHSRDLKILVNCGYKIKEIYLLDFYPQTHHIESLAILEKDL